jgi:hypothetical protein
MIQRKRAIGVAKAGNYWELWIGQQTLAHFENGDVLSKWLS